MKVIDEFEKNYKSENTIWWYTRESCFYQMMNKTLRVQDFDMLFALSLFITDIAKQIKMIGNDKRELMKNSIGEFLSMKSFLSTNRDRSTALDFVRLTSKIDDLQLIIFEIEINPHLETKPFVGITQTSYFQKENEGLIMRLDHCFELKKLLKDKKERIWVARVPLAIEDDYHLKETFSYVKNWV